MIRGRRIAIVHAVLAVFATAIIGRAALVQVVQGDVWSARAQRQHVAAAKLPAPRGLILDEKGVPLAESRERVRIEVAPGEVRDVGKLARELRRAGAPARTIERLRDPGRSWVTVPGTFAPAELEAVLAMRGVYATPVAERVYAESPGVRRVIGRADAEGRGIEGIELVLDSLLSGEVGRATFVRDGRGRRFTTPDQTVAEPLPGHTIVLTINHVLQDIVDRALGDAVARMGADGGDIVVLDPHSGEIRAMAARRRDPRSASATAFNEPYEPGSTLKPFIAAAVIARGKAKTGDVVETYNGVYRTFGRTIRDVHAESRMSLADVIRHSSNVGIVRFAERLSPREQYEALRDFGFGTPTGVPYPLEAAGRLRQPRAWSKQSAASLAMGYEISVTPLQLALAYASLANGGELLEPVLIKEIRDREGRVVFQSGRRVVRRVLTPAMSATMRELLAAVVDSGTGTSAELTTLAVAGKSGTVRGMSGGRYVAGSYTASFVGLFPADDPKYVILVKVDNPRGASYYGGKTAAPVSKVVLEAAIAARDAALPRSALAHRRSEPVFASRDTGAVRGDPPLRSIAIATGSVSELRGEAADSGADATPAAFVVTIGETPRRIAPPVRVRPVPDVRGMPLREAVHALHRSGFRVQLGQGASGITVPGPGTPIRAGSVVRLYHDR